MPFAEWIDQIIVGQSLSESVAGEAISSVMRGEMATAQVASLLTALRCKGETLDEIAGAARAMRDHALPIPTNQTGLIDTCGTGGDRSGTFNISTLTALIVAGTGAPVAKHGNRSATSKCGSIDLLECLGVNINLGPDGIARCINQCGIGVLFARMVHPAMKHAAPVRAELGFRTIFNFLGPLTNPAKPTYQLVGISDATYMELYAKCLHKMGIQRAWVAHGTNGLDELSLTGPSKIVEMNGGDISSFQITPQDAGLEPCAIEDLLGGDAEQNAVLAMAILKNEDSGAKRDAALLNAGAVLTIAGKASEIKAGVALARESLQSGAAYKKLQALIEVSNG
ncbi:MAG: anthranilate phosphoribosyltransferase [Candidatus Hinthialibacter antarcticus]|nr:anthranilate phosphoribosyltransferase [Candidatus Hinthialibacter antarcticus]